VIGRGLRLDIGHVRAVRCDDCLQKVVGGGDCGQRGFHRDRRLRLSQNSEKKQNESHRQVMHFQTSM
jgi:hypothetical protein